VPDVSCLVYFQHKVAHTLAANIVVIFRTYDAGRDEPAVKCAIWEVARAAVARPPRQHCSNGSKSVHRSVPSPSFKFVDGGLGRNNPTAVLKPCVLSIDAGQAQTVALPRPSLPQRTNHHPARCG
jgi:patatin-like phospholipase/acyl hydrolase